MLHGGNAYWWDFVSSSLNRQSCSLSRGRSERASPGNGTGRQRLHAVWHQRRSDRPGVPATHERRPIRKVFPRSSLPAHRLLRHEGHCNQPSRWVVVGDGVDAVLASERGVGTRNVSYLVCFQVTWPNSCPRPWWENTATRWFSVVGTRRTCPSSHPPPTAPSLCGHTTLDTEEMYKLCTKNT